MSMSYNSGISIGKFEKEVCEPSPAKVYLLAKNQVQSKTSEANKKSLL